MGQSIFINLSVSDLSRSITFYESIGFVQHPFFSDATAASMVLRSNPTIAVMLITPDKFRGFTPVDKQVADASKSCEMLLALSMDTRAEVDAAVKGAVQAGGKAHPIVETGYDGMYYRSYEDPDGHVLEAVWSDKEVVKTAEKALAAVLAEKK